MKVLLKKYLSMMALSFLVISCGQDEDKNGDPASSSFKVFMTDSAANYQEVNVAIEDVKIHSSNNGWQSLNVNSGVYNLLDFTNGKDTLIASDNLPSGQISQIRLVLGSNNTIKTKGQIQDLKVPSGSQSGLKLQINADLKDGITYAITLDFDAAKSVHETGNNRYILRPVIHTITEGTDGILKGSVTPAAAKPVIYAIDQSDTTSTYADTTGQFQIQGLSDGTYQVNINSQNPYKDTVVSNVSVSPGQVTNMGTIDVN